MSTFCKGSTASSRAITSKLLFPSKKSRGKKRFFRFCRFPAFFSDQAQVPRAWARLVWIGVFSSSPQGTKGAHNTLETKPETQNKMIQDYTRHYIYIYIIVSCVLDYSSSGYFKHFAMRTHNPSFSICLLLLKPANGSQVSPHPSPFFCERLNLGSLVLSYFVSSFSTLVSAVCFLSPFSPQIQTSNISCSARSSFSFCSWSRFSKSCTLQNLTTSHALMSNTKHCCTASHASHLLNFWTGSACRVREIFEKTGNGPKQGNTFEKTAKMD